MRHGGAGLVVQLHGYGADERQFDTLLPLGVPVTTVTPPAPELVEPGRGWWTPAVQGGRLELAPADGVDRAVDLVADTIERWQLATGHGPERTALVGYSQGASLALTVVSRRPGLVGAAATAAGFLLPDEAVVTPAPPVRMLVMNGTLDPIVDEPTHRSTVERLRAAGHDVIDRRDRVPHVLDRAQADAIDRHLGDWLDRGTADDPRPAGTGRPAAPG